MANFHNAFIKVIKAEGGYVNDPDDKGGETYLGISRRNHPDSSMWAVIDDTKKRNPGISNKNLTTILKQNPRLDATAKLIYKTKYWDVLKLDDVYSQKIAEQMFDMAVNAGVSTAIKLAQRILDMKDHGKYTNELHKRLSEYGNLQ